MKWRNIGPSRGGRTKAAAGHPSHPYTFYIGVSNGGVWKTNDFGDSLVNTGVGLAMAVSSRTQFKIELQDSYKNKPPTAKTKKNDLATILALVFKL